MLPRATFFAGFAMLGWVAAQASGQTAGVNVSTTRSEAQPLVRVVLPQSEPATPFPADAGLMGPPYWLAPDYVEYRDPFAAAGYRAIPPYDGPRLRDGYGGDGAQAFRYGLEEWSHRSRFDPFYRESYRSAIQRLSREDMTRRAERLLSQAERAMLAGLDALKRGDAEQAVVALTMASRLNEADPASRIHLAQARLALGHYDAAAAALRRGLQLQPKLLYTDLHLADQYPQPTDLELHRGQLKAWLSENPAGAEVYFLLGYLEFQRGSFDSAARVLARVQSVLPRDTLTRDLLEITGPGGEAASARPAASTARRAPRRRRAACL